MILLITLDGFSPEYLELVRLPAIGWLLDRGTRVVDARACFPTVTTVNMASLLTGSYPDSTGIGCVPLYDRGSERLIAAPRGIRRPTIAELLAARGYTTAAVNHFLLAGRGARIYLEGDAADAARLIAETRPDFLAFLHGELDAVGHRYGPSGPEIRAALARADEAVALILRALQEEGLLEGSVIALNSDHGMSGFGRPACGSVTACLEELGLRVQELGPSDRPAPDAQVIMVKAGNRHVFWRGPVPADLRKTAEERLASLHGTVLFRPSDLAAMHCDPATAGDLVVTAQPGFVLEGSGGPGGLHGRLEEAGIIMGFHGGRAVGGKVIDHGEIVDVCPSLLALAGLAPGRDMDGRVLI